MKLEEIEEKILEIEAQMASADFWADKAQAQKLVKELQELKIAREGGGGTSGPYDSYDAILTIFSGAGGDDAEDFSAMLLNMYLRFFASRGWSARVLHENKNDHGGYRNVTVEILEGGKAGDGAYAGAAGGKGVYGTLKKESGVHRLVRISPFNAKKLRHTSFSLVEFIPKFEKTSGGSATELDIPENELRVEFSRSSGPGGQNVNKRETAVRLVHIPTNLSAHSENERSQAQNKEKALTILKGKLYKAMEEQRVKKEQDMYISKTTSIEWGNQIRSYVTHPYKMVKDHRTDVETSKVGAVFEGEIEEFIEAEKML